MNARFKLWICLALVALGCSESNFGGGGGTQPGKVASPAPTSHPGGDKPNDGRDGPQKPDGNDGDDDDSLGGSDSNGGGESDAENALGQENGPNGAIVDTSEPQPEDLAEFGDGSVGAPPDLNACVSLPTQGKQNYGAQPKCPENAVVVVVNDGKAPELTCCPLKGKNVLSKKAEELFVQRNGRCGGDEVVVGMTSPAGPALFCSKLNTKYLKLQGTTGAIYAKGSSSLSPVMQTIADGYNVGDACICPEGTVYIGDHTEQDNTCVDQCAKIVKK